ncbi:hypothetical protein EDC23_0739 [Thiohalophilus thiocyanatoxydans]|uniref:Uncharacterized protein n=1 Tax=Thiohalophilus thiocyanatoxydans TaxID=381308 RepID=A0A4R8IV83_9GAMM|nr:hypothetical protein EDC23_0739 [Thiohalophilus thiocyanatoxydans]
MRHESLFQNPALPKGESFNPLSLTLSPEGRGNKRKKSTRRANISIPRPILILYTLDYSGTEGGSKEPV